MTGAAEFNTSGHHLLLNGKPFFWLGDTVWLLAQVPSREDLEVYLDARQKQGFTVIQLTAVMGEERVWSSARTNSFGHKPFLNEDLATPNVTPGNNPKNPAEYDYWDHLDYVLRRIHEHGMRAAVVALFVGSQGEGYKLLRKENALQYGRFLGERYRSQPQIIWILGGDNSPDTETEKEVWDRVARGITQGACGKEDFSQTFMTYHINGGRSSSEFWHNSPWLDFNMAQTWSEYKDIYGRVQTDYAKTPVKPCGLGEGAYEDGPQYPTKPIDGLVIRKQAYWSYFAGGYHTYGNGNVWHFDTLKAELTQPWKEALNSPGARSLLTLRRFFERIRWSRLIPDQELLTGFEGDGANRNCAMRTPERDEFVFYLTASNEVALSLGVKGESPKIKALWVNPENGMEMPARYTPRVSVPKGWKDALLYLTE